MTLRNLKVHRLVLGAVPHENVGIPLGRSLDKRLDRMAELNLVGLVGEVGDESRKSVEALLDDLARSGVVDLGSGRSGTLGVDENPTSRTRLSVCSKSSSVSPGKPTMMSVDRAMPGLARLMRSAKAR